MRKVFGVIKAYATRVGNGPFPTKIDGVLEKELREIGNEFGARTGRARDTGWLDLPALRFAIMANGVTDLVIVKVDCLDSFKEILVCTSYDLNGKKKKILDFDMTLEKDNIKPIYKKFVGWEEKTSGIRGKTDFPKKCLEYLRYLEKELNTPIHTVSVGPGKDDVVLY